MAIFKVYSPDKEVVAVEGVEVWDTGRSLVDPDFSLDYFFMPQMVQNGTQNKALFILSGERK